MTQRPTQLLFLCIIALTSCAHHPHESAPNATSHSASTLTHDDQRRARAQVDEVLGALDQLAAGAGGGGDFANTFRIYTIAVDHLQPAADAAHRRGPADLAKAYDRFLRHLREIQHTLAPNPTPQALPRLGQTIDITRRDGTALKAQIALAGPPIG